jgi:hypothetical protein
MTHESVLIRFGLDVDVKRETIVAALASWSSRRESNLILLVKYIVPSATSFPAYWVLGIRKNS